MTDTQQPRALQFSDQLRALYYQHPICVGAAEELRRQHQRIRELEAELKGAQADVAILQEQLDAVGAGGVTRLQPDAGGQ